LDYSDKAIKPEKTKSQLYEEIRKLTEKNEKLQRAVKHHVPVGKYRHFGLGQ
jgi:hypothetical protein